MNIGDLYFVTVWRNVYSSAECEEIISKILAEEAFVLLEVDVGTFHWSTVYKIMTTKGVIGWIKLISGYGIEIKKLEESS